MGFGGADLHCHSVFSDGQDAPAALVKSAVEAGLSALALSDHDGVLGIADLEQSCKGTGLVPVPAVELSARFDHEDAHVLGLFVDPEEGTLVRQLAGFRQDRQRRGEAMVARLSALGFPIGLEEIRKIVGGGSFGRPHVARAMVGLGYVASEDEAFERFLKRGAPAWLPKPKWKLEDAVAAVHRAGGLAVLAHPIVYGDPEAVIRAGKEAGLDGLEVMHSDQDDVAEARFRSLARRHGLLESAGSDCHGIGNGRRQIGIRRLGRPEWKGLVAAASERRLAAGRPPIDVEPR